MKLAKQHSAAMAALLLLGSVGRAEAALNAVDPGNPPGTYLAANGFFPAWYQDTNGLALDLCLSTAAGANGPMCVLLANPGVFDPGLPIEFPVNFPDEAFWFTGDATVTDAAQGVDLTYVSALEAAFGTGLPLAGDQITFARIRIRADVPVAGTYTITHPYGLETFNVAAGGTRAINMTRDIGIGAPGDFTGALAGDIGPFLRSVNGPYRVGTETFIGDPNLLEPVTGSPFATNFVRIEGPGGIVAQTNLFAVSGKISTVVLPTPLVIERSSYSRSGLATTVAQQDVFAKAPPTSNPVSFVDANGTSIPMTDGDANAAWFGQSASDPTLPATITVTAANAASNNTPTTQSSALVDLVSISRADYSLASGTLIVEAASSDEVTPPALTANGQPMALVGAGPVQTTTFTGLTIPPARVTVSSANGGSDTEAVVILP
jgi:hypothetical protein